MLEIRLFGACRVLQDGRDLAISSLRQQSLLAYLLLHTDTPQSRQRVAFELWPDVSEPHARNSLRNLLFQTRRLIPDLDSHIEASATMLRWRPDASNWCDIREFTRLIAAAEDSQAHETRRLALVQAVNLYQGMLLPGCYDEWLVVERIRLEDQFGRALHTLIDLNMEAGNISEAVNYATRLLHHDPLDETIYRRLMQLHLTNAAPLHALRIFEACRRMLAAEFQADPDPATLTIAQEARFRQNRLIEYLPMASTPAPAHALSEEGAPSDVLHPVTNGQPAAHPPAIVNGQSIDSPTSESASAFSPASNSLNPEEPWLIGRDAEWATLVAAWQGTLLGKSHIVLIRGEAGIGKTRLATEFLGWVHQQSVPVAQANCFSTDVNSAYEPVLAWLRTPVFAQQRSSLASVWLVELARLLPEILVERPELQPAESITESWHRRRMFQALSQGLAIVDHPILLLIDDLHWADQETVQWLSYFFRQMPPIPVLMLATLREEDALDLPWLQQVLVEWRRRGLLQELAPARLSAAETLRLAEEITGATIHPQTAARLYDGTLGNPLFVVETARAGLAVLDEIYPDALCPPSLGEPPQIPPVTRVFPLKIQAAIESRLARLSAAALELLQSASVIGREFPLGLLAATSGKAETEILDALEELWNRHLIQDSHPLLPSFEPPRFDPTRFDSAILGPAIRAEGMQLGTPELLQASTAARPDPALNTADVFYAFSHDRVREFVYLHISAVRRRTLHRRLANTLAASQPAGDASTSNLIAFHYERADSLDQAVRYYMAAALHADGIHAYHESEQLYGRAMQIAARLNLPARTLVIIYIERGRMLEMVGQYERAVEIYTEFDLLAQRRADRNMEAYAVLHLAACFIEPSTVHDRARALPVLARGFRLLPYVDHPRVEAGLLWCRVIDAAHYGADDETEAACLKGLDFCERHNLNALWAWFLKSLALHYYLTNRHTLARTHAEEALFVFLRINDPAMAAGVLNQRAAHAYHQLDFEAARLSAQDAAILTQRIQNPSNLGQSYLLQGLIALQEGDLLAGLRQYEACMQLERAADMVHMITYAQLELGRIYRLAGDVETALAYHRQAFLFAQDRLPYLLHAAASQLAVDYFSLNSLAEGEKYLALAEAHQPGAGLARALFVFAYYPEALVAYARRTGNWQAIATVVRARLDEANNRNLPFYRPPLQLYRAECCLALGAYDAAREALDALVPLAESANLLWIRWQSARLLAKLAGESGHDCDRRSYAAQAQTLAVQLAENLPPHILQFFVS